MRLTISFGNKIKQVQQLIKHDLGIVTEDKYVIHVRAGTGGNGLSRYNGAGGSGGNVYALATPGMAFVDIRKNLNNSMAIRAASGISSQKIKLMGENGDDAVLQVPVGVDIVNEENNFLIARCRKPYQKYVIAEGGEGGNATNGFRGQKGGNLNISIHLKLRPNIGLVGFPNAGKSTLMSAFVPKKSVKIAAYPFTTVSPQVAFWSTSDRKDEMFSLSLADLPGLIEGASRNRGKGHKFLKHLEYSEILCFVIDSLGFQLKSSLDEPFRTPMETVAILNKELEHYDISLVKKPAVLLLNKIDKVTDRQLVDQLVSRLRGPDWHLSVDETLRPLNPMRFDYVGAISARYGAVEELKKMFIRLYNDLHPNFAEPIEDKNYIMDVSYA